MNASSEVEALKPELKVVHEKLKATNQQLTATQQKLLKEQDERQKLNDAVVEAEHEVVKARSDAKAQQRETTVQRLCVADCSLQRAVTRRISRSPRSRRTCLACRSGSR